MNLQAASNRPESPSRTLSIRAAQRLPAGAGVLVVTEGRVWLSRRGDLDDHVLTRGQMFRLGPGDDALVEPWRRGDRVRLEWRPEGQRLGWRDLPALVFATGKFAWAWLFAADSVEPRLPARARNAASRANRAQGNIKAGESMASCGALK